LADLFITAKEAMEKAERLVLCIDPGRPYSEAGAAIL